MTGAWEALIDAWPLVALATYSASAAVGIGYSASNLTGSWRDVTELGRLRHNGAALAAGLWWRKVHLALLGAQALEALLVLASVGAGGSGGAPAARGVVAALILIAANLLLSFASVASTNGRRRVWAYVMKESRRVPAQGERQR